MGFERLTALDASFLHIESDAQPQHVGSLSLFEAGPFFGSSGRFRLDDVRDVIAGRLHLVPRFRQRIMSVPLEQGRPVWVDDERFDLGYHVRLTALPRPGTEEQLKTLMGRLQAQRLDRRRPLWELWFVEGVIGADGAPDGRVALIQKTHHAMVDGVSGVDVATVLFDLEPEPPRSEAPAWSPEPAPSPTQLMVESIVERATEPAEIVRSARAALRAPREAIEGAVQMGRAVMGVTTVSAPPMAWNAPISPRRRFAPARVPLARAKAIKDGAARLDEGGERFSVNDVVLAACAGALRSLLIARGETAPDDLVLRAFVPVSIRDDSEHLALGNRVSAMTTDLPVGEADPLSRLRLAHDGMAASKASGEAVGADRLIQMTRYLPPTILGVASRLVTRTRAFNLGITNVPGPQFPLYCLGARLLEAFPYVPVFEGQGLTIGVLSYDGKLGFGLSADHDLVPDLDQLAGFVEEAFVELDDAVGGAR